MSLWFKSTLLFIEATLRTKGGLPKPFYQETQPQTITSVNSQSILPQSTGYVHLQVPLSFLEKSKIALSYKISDLIILASYTTLVYNIYVASSDVVFS